MSRPFLCSLAPTWERTRRNNQSCELSFTLPPLLLLILVTAPLVQLEVGHPVPVDLGHHGEGLPQATPHGLELGFVGDEVVGSEPLLQELTGRPGT